MRSYMYTGTEKHIYESFSLFLCPYMYVCFLRIFFVIPTAEKMKGMLLSGLSTHGYKSLNKAAGGITEYDYKARRKSEAL